MREQGDGMREQGDRMREQGEDTPLSTPTQYIKLDQSYQIDSLMIKTRSKIHKNTSN